MREGGGREGSSSEVGEVVVSVCRRGGWEHREQSCRNLLGIVKTLETFKERSDII